MPRLGCTSYVEGARCFLVAGIVSPAKKFTTVPAAASYETRGRIHSSIYIVVRNIFAFLCHQSASRCSLYKSEQSRDVAARHPTKRGKSPVRQIRFPVMIALALIGVLSLY